MFPLYGIAYNFAQGGAANGDYQLIANGLSSVMWGNGGYGPSRVESGYTDNNPGWAGLAAFHSNAGGCRIWAKRAGDIIEVKTSQWNDPNNLDSNTLLTIDLKSNPRLERFRGEKPYGFASYSQRNSYWDVIQFTNPKDAIYDLINKKVYVFNVSGWIESTEIKFGDLPRLTILSNPETSRMFFVQADDKIINMGTSPLV